MTALTGPSDAKEEFPKKGGKMKDREARVGMARKENWLPDKATNALPGASEPHGKSKIKSRRNAQQMTRPTGKPKLGVRVQNPQSMRVRMVLLPWLKKGWRTRFLKRLLPRGPQKGWKPNLLLLISGVGPRWYLYHWLGRQQFPKAQEGLACQPSPLHLKGPVRR